MATKNAKNRGPRNTSAKCSAVEALDRGKSGKTRAETQKKIKKQVTFQPGDVAWLQKAKKNEKRRGRRAAPSEISKKADLSALLRVLCVDSFISLPIVLPRSF